jgi:hypothetical protein
MQLKTLSRFRDIFMYVNRIVFSVCVSVCVCVVCKELQDLTNADNAHSSLVVSAV